MLERLVQLVVQVLEPKRAMFWLALARYLRDDGLDIFRVTVPQWLVIEQIDVHKLVNHLDDASMHVA